MSYLSKSYLVVFTNITLNQVVLKQVTVVSNKMPHLILFPENFSCHLIGHFSQTSLIKSAKIKTMLVKDRVSKTLHVAVLPFLLLKRLIKSTTLLHSDWVGIIYYHPTHLAWQLVTQLDKDPNRDTLVRDLKNPTLFQKCYLRGILF